MRSSGLRCTASTEDDQGPPEPPLYEETAQCPVHPSAARRRRAAEFVGVKLATEIRAEAAASAGESATPRAGQCLARYAARVARCGSLLCVGQHLARSVRGKPGAPPQA